MTKHVGRLNRLGVLAGAALLGACHATPPTEYHEAAAHPFVIVENTVQLALGDIALADMATRAAVFAATRPNAGSSFTIGADAAAAQTIARALMAQGVPSSDIEIAAARSASITRLDRSVRVEGCGGTLAPALNLGSLDDGYAHSNANSVLLGCSVRLNIAAMTADPRTLVAAMPYSGRSGARAADIYAKWTRGEPTQVPGEISAARTSDLTSGGGKP
jgi:type IV pilus biogenesis protein CpaD/CtpE